MTLTTHTITLPTPEQRAVYAACEERYGQVLSHHWAPLEAGLRLKVPDAEGLCTNLVVATDGTTRVAHQGFVPTRLYGWPPKREDARREWGRGLPKHAVKHMPTPSDDSGDESQCDCGAGEHESCRCATRPGEGGDPTMQDGRRP